MSVRRPLWPLRAAALVLFVAFPVPSRAQERAPRPLATAMREFPEPFSSIGVIVELADGRLLVNDTRERRLGVADLATGSFRETAREGAGPNEYRMLASIVPMPGDSAVAWDLGNSRRLLFAPDGTPAGTSAVTGPGGATMRFGMPVPEMSDARGRWYAMFQGMTVGAGAIQTADSFAIVRLTPGREGYDTLATLPVAKSAPTERTGGKLRVHATGFPARDGWGVFRDGSVLIVRGATYMPEIVRPDGSVLRAAAIPHARLPVTAADRVAHIKETEARMSRMGAMMGAEIGANVSGVEVIPPDPWQESHPAILSTRIPVDSRGRAWVHAMDRDRSSGERYDLLDAQGRLVDSIRLPKGLKYAAMGDGVVYLTREDEDGLLYIRRYALP